MIALMKRILSVSGPYQRRIKLAFVFAFLKAMIEREADPNFLAYDGRNALFEAVGGCSFAYSNTDEKAPELEAHIRA